MNPIVTLAAAKYAEALAAQTAAEKEAWAAGVVADDAKCRAGRAAEAVDHAARNMRWAVAGRVVEVNGELVEVPLPLTTEARP